MYFNWLVSRIAYDRHTIEKYGDILAFLHGREFIWSIYMDANRAADGIELRGVFAEEAEINYILIRKWLGGPCSVLEMMVGLALRIENTIMGDGEIDQTPHWFWEMMASLGLDHMTNVAFREEICDQILENCMSRTFERSGKGGFFTIKSGTTDMRELEIWYQLQEYLSENYS